MVVLMLDMRILETGPATSGVPDSAQWLPLTSMQRAMVFDELALGSPNVNYLQIPVTLRGEVDRGGFVAALVAELALQPAARITLQNEQAPAANFGMQRIADVEPDQTAMQIAFDQAPAYFSDRLISVRPCTAHDVVWLACHHAIADRPGLEALVRRAARRYCGQPNSPPGSYPAAIAAINKAQQDGAQPCSAAAVRRVDTGAAMAATGGAPIADLSITRLTRAVSSSAWQALCQRAQALRVSEQQVVAAMAQIALDRCRDSDGAVMGIPVSLRDGLADPELLGCFIGTIGVTAPVSSQTTCQAFLTDWRDQFLDSYEQRWHPAMGKAQEFAMLFAWHDACVAGLDAGWAELGIAAPYPGRTPLSLAAQQQAGTLVLALDYDPAQIDAGAAAALIDLLVMALVRLAGAKTGQAISLDEAFATISPTTGHADAAVPAFFSVLADHARLRPADIAITGCAGHNVNYAELAQGMARVASWAMAAPSGVIGLCMRRDPAIVITLLGLLHNGRTVALLDAEAGPAFLQSVSAEMAAVCGVESDVRQLDGSEAIANILARAPSASDSASDSGGDQSDCAGVVIYTSGSTGAARPVLLGFDTIVRHAAWAEQAFGLTAKDRVLQFCAMAFDAMLEEVLPVLRAGGTSVLRNAAAGQGGAALLQFCAESRVSVADLPTGFFSLAAFDLAGATWPSALRLIVIGGEAYQTEPLRRWQELARPNGASICTSYGPTEATIVVTFQALAPNAPAGLIGAARPGSVLYVLDRHGRHTPPGCVGELYLTGSALARGYLGRPADTADRFVPNPYANAGTIMYRTGDQVRARSDGQIGFIGRVDRQVKLGGRRFEIDRVEQQFAQITGAPVAVHVPALPGAKPRLWIGAPRNPQIASKLDAFIAAMPAWQRPAQIRFGALPLTDRGKVDRHRLAAMLTDANSASAAEPSAVESPSLALIREVLHQPSAKSDDDFLALGGSSLTVLLLAGLIRSRLNKAVAVSVLYADTGIQAMSDAIERAPPAPAQPGRYPAEGQTGGALARESTASGSWPVSPYETALYLDAVRQADESAYRIAAAWRVNAVLDHARFSAAVAAVLKRHRLLSAQITERDGTLCWQPIAQQCTPATRIEMTLDQATNSTTIALETSHMACDAAGIALLLSDLARAYDTAGEYLGESHVPLPPDHSPDLQAKWQSRLAACYATALPASQPAADQAADLAGTETAFETAPCRANGPNAGSGDAPGTTPFVSSLTAVCAWLARVCGENGATVWTPVRLEPVTGVRLAMTTLPVTIQVLPEATYLHLCEAVRQELGWVLDHRQIDSTQLAGVLPRGTVGRGGLSVLFDLIDERATIPPYFAGAPAQALPQAITTVRADLEISTTITADGSARYQLRGRRTLYHEATLNGWAQSLAEFSAKLRCQPDAPQSDLALTAASDGTTVHGSRLYQPDRHPEPQPLPERLVAALKDRAAACVIGPAQQLNGVDVLALAARLAAELSASGAICGHSVEIALPRCPAYPAALLAIWSIGAVPILINPALPPAAQAGMRAVSGAAFQIHANAATTVPTVTRCAAMDAPSQDANTAYGAFTSGTTGTPKLVLVAWPGLEALLNWAQVALPMSRSDRFLHLATPGFDIALFEMLHPLLCGADLLIADETTDPIDLTRFAERQRATHLHLVPALLGAFLDLATPAVLDRIKLVMCGGDTVSVDLARRVLALGIAFQHCYGPTETTIFVASSRIDANDCTQDFLSLGVPVNGSGLAVCDRFGHILPRGIAGDLIVFGTSLAAGYFRDGRSTADRFEPSLQAGGRQYRTGDRAIIGANGSLRHLGRVDRQLKISGVRIEPAAVEAALENHQDVSRAAVFAVERGGTAALVAVVRQNRGRAEAPADLPSHLREHLSARFHAAAVPSRILVVAELPTTANGKLDYAALRELVVLAGAQAPDETDLSEHATHDPRLRILIEIWTEILDQPVRPVTDFFAAGGDSMTAIRMVARAARAGIALSIADIFRHPTPQSLIALIDDRGQRAPDFHPAEPGDPAPLAPAARDWLARTTEFGEQDVLAIAIDLAAEIGPARLADALASLIIHHDALRLAVTRADAGWRCEFAAPYRPASPAAASQNAGLDLAIAAVQPAQGRMLGAAWIAGPTPQAVLAVHHLAIDPGSWATLVQDLQQALATDANCQSGVPPFSTSCRRRDPAFAWVRSTIATGARSALASVNLPGAKVSQAAFVDAVVRVLSRETAGRKIVIAAEQDGRTGDETGIIGWFTEFAGGAAQLGFSDPLGLPGARDAAITVLVNIAARSDLAANWTVLRADVAPVHPLAMELAEGITGWTLTLASDATWSEPELQRIGAAVAAQLHAPNGPEPIPALPLQLAMVLAATAGKSQTAYHTQIVFEPVGGFNPDLLVRAWQDAHTAHDALRLCFNLTPDEPLPTLAIMPASAAVDIPVMRIADKSMPAEAVLAEYLANDLLDRFAAGQPLSRIALLQGEESWRLVWSHHHAVLDGWSLNLVTQTVAACYAARLAQAPLPSPAPSIRSFAEWWQRQSRSELDLAAQRLIDSWPRGQFPRARTAISATRVSTVAQLDRQTTAALRNQARCAKVTLFELCLAACGIVDAQRNGDSAGMFHFIASLRPEELAEIDVTVGLCMNVLPLRFAISRSLTDLLRLVRSSLTQTMQIAAASPFAVAKSLREADLDQRFDTLVVFENYPGDRTGVPLGQDGFLHVHTAREEGEARFTLVLLPDEVLTIELLHPDDSPSCAQAQAMLAALTKVLRHFANLNRPAAEESPNGA